MLDMILDLYILGMETCTLATLCHAMVQNGICTYEKSAMKRHHSAGVRRELAHVDSLPSTTRRRIRGYAASERL
jgi:hypothetical protein